MPSRSTLICHLVWPLYRSVTAGKVCPNTLFSVFFDLQRSSTLRTETLPVSSSTESLRTRESKGPESPVSHHPFHTSLMGLHPTPPSVWELGRSLRKKDGNVCRPHQNRLPHFSVRVWGPRSFRHVQRYSLCLLRRFSWDQRFGRGVSESPLPCLRLIVTLFPLCRVLLILVVGGSGRGSVGSRVGPYGRTLRRFDDSCR